MHELVGALWDLQIYLQYAKHDAATISTLRETGLCSYHKEIHIAPPESEQQSARDSFWLTGIRD